MPRRPLSGGNLQHADAPNEGVRVEVGQQGVLQYGGMAKVVVHVRFFCIQ